MDSNIIEELILDADKILESIENLEDEKKPIVWGVILNFLFFEKFLSKERRLILINSQQPILEIKHLSIPEFYNLVKPSTHNDSILLFAFWLKVNNEQELFEPKDIDSCYSDSIIKPPKNLHDSMRKLASGEKALLVREKKGIYRLSHLGIDHINKLLSEINNQDLI